MLKNIYILLALSQFPIVSTYALQSASEGTEVIAINEDDLIYEEDCILVDTKKGIQPVDGIFWQGDQLCGIVLAEDAYAVHDD